jgi:hypothetical protein
VRLNGLAAELHGHLHFESLVTSLQLVKETEVLPFTSAVGDEAANSDYLACSLLVDL